MGVLLLLLNICSLVELVLGYHALPIIDISSSISALAKAADRPDWTSLDDIDIPVRQCALSHCIADYSIMPCTANIYPCSEGS